ncbi:uncharacterized protein LOC122250454 [Penaeus japonicus]|uniref:uncharacterized protein LOC122250454 n=1 Tax=Penaeus japonicus TaxID=27405 RepID=UPI001C712C32|nr:uncharacterized protein LOC122250454 [Penaeus japonicus]
MTQPTHGGCPGDMVAPGVRMVLAQLLVMSHFLASLSHISADMPLFANINDINSIEVSAGCPYGCVKCSAINGCLACKPPFFLLLRRDGPRQTASCARTCPKGFYKVTKKRNGFCAKCTMRGCVECDRHHYCSKCNQDFVNFFGKCIPNQPENSLEMPYTRKTIYSPPTILEPSGTPSSKDARRPPHRTAGSSRTPSVPAAGPPRAPPAGSTGRSSSAPPSSMPPVPPALVNYSRPAPSSRGRPRRPDDKRPCKKKSAKRDKEGGRRRNWKGRKKERQNKNKKGQKNRRRGCRKRLKGRRNAAKSARNSTLPRGKSSRGSPEGDALPERTLTERNSTQGGVLTPNPSAEVAPQPPHTKQVDTQEDKQVDKQEDKQVDKQVDKRRRPAEDPPDSYESESLTQVTETLDAPTLRGLRSGHTRSPKQRDGRQGKTQDRVDGLRTQVTSADEHRWQRLDTGTSRRTRVRPSTSVSIPRLTSRHKRRHKHEQRSRIPPPPRTRLYVT